jgi:putative transcriptional regulator
MIDENELNFRKILALNMRVARARKDYTQETLAELSGISFKHITKIENAKVTPNIYFVHNIAKALDVTIDELVTEYKK